jgi:hypothetical protein
MSLETPSYAEGQTPIHYNQSFSTSGAATAMSLETLSYAEGQTPIHYNRPLSTNGSATAGCNILLRRSRDSHSGGHEG